MSANLTAFEQLLDDDRYDDKGMMKPIVEGETGTSAPPEPEKPENTAATQPSPDATPAPASEKPAEDKSGAAKPEATATEAGKPPATAEKPAPTTDEETEDAIKARLSKPEDKGDEWRMRAFREGEKLRKRLAPIQAQLERINSTERATRGLELVAVLGDPEADIAEAVDKMTALSSSRTKALVDFVYTDILDHFPDDVATDLVGENVTVQELKDGLALLRSGAKAGQETKQPQPAATTIPVIEMPKPADVTDEDWADFKVDYPDAYSAINKQWLASQQKPAEPVPAEKPPVDPKEAEKDQRLQQYEQAERQQRVQAAVEEIDREGKQLYSEVFSVVEDGLRELGLEPDTAKDDERTIGLKKTTADSIRSVMEDEFEGPDGPNGIDDWSLCSDEQKENRKLVKKVMGLLADRDFNAAKDYREHLQARLDLTFQRVAKSKMDLFNAAMIQPTTPTRNAGQDSHKRPEIVAGTAAAAGGTNGTKTPWLEPGFRLPGESVFEAMNRYMEGADALPGR